MKKKYIFTLVTIVAILAVFTVGVVFADDGPLFSRNISRTPETMTSGAQITMFPLYVPAQNTSREFVDIEYLVGEDCTYSNPEGCTPTDYWSDSTDGIQGEIRPLFASYEDGLEHEVEERLLSPSSVKTGTGFGDRDAWGALSLDDGATWRNYNLSESADRSSFVLRNGEDYPGDVFRIMHNVSGNKIAVAWISRYCEGGSPLYSWQDDEKDGLLVAYPDLAHPVDFYDPDDGSLLLEEPLELYMDDVFGVAGSQGSVDYTLQGFPEVGEIPYGCVWVARGTLEPVACDEAGECSYAPGSDSGLYDIVWRKAERLTSGRRDANRVDITAAPGAGFIISWQEDPDGLRPGKGLGPGEGWSGAIANAKTDIWYTYIDWEDFDDVCTDDPDLGYCTPGELPDFGATLLETKPKIAVPFAVPMRLTDNNMCKGVPKYDSGGDLMDAYCFADFDVDGDADLCEQTVDWLNPGGTTIKACVADDGRVMNGRTASMRVRWGIKSYTTNLDEDEDGVDDVVGWVVMAEEKMKAMGDIETEEDVLDVGKDMWYHTFKFNDPELVEQGLMLNAPALDPETGEPFETYTDIDWGIDGYDYTYHETEIARRFNLMIQGVGDAMASENQTSAILLTKMGILNQGGPADIFLRRVVLPDDFDPNVDNPFDYDNVVCDALGVNGTETDWLYTPDTDGIKNPNYVRGLCVVEGVNVSGTTIVTCDDGSSGETCADAFPWEGSEDQNAYPKVIEWVQEGPVDGTEDFGNLDDPSWANPYDVSKGHRGFIDGDFVMLMYATAPNWKANTIGNEAYNLYIRRSFDGGQTWTNLPASYTHIDGVTYSGEGTEFCEYYGWGGQVEECTLLSSAAGEFEQARNVSRLTGSRRTVLDPRYTPSGGMLKTSYESLVCDEDLDGQWTKCLDTSKYELIDARDPSVYFVTYEVGDNTVVDVDTAAVPMDMYYSRGTSFGDIYDEINVCDDIEYPDIGVTCEEGEEILRWDWLENGPEIAAEASLTSTPAGDRFYQVWSQELEIAVEVYTDMDIEFRRIFYNVITDEVPVAEIVHVSDRTPIVDEDLILVGDAWDNDPFFLPGDGIVAVEWSHTALGVTSPVSDGDEDGMTLVIPGGSLALGDHTFSFRAQDNEGNWSELVSVNIEVRRRFMIFFPFWIGP